MQVVHSSQPSIPVVIVSGRGITRVFDFQDRETQKPVHIERRALQGSFTDSEGTQTICVCVPETGWNLDLAALERKNLTLFCTHFQLDRSGVCILRFCGYDLSEVKK